MTTVRFLIEGEQDPREMEVENFDFDEYKAVMQRTKTDEHGNALNDVFIGFASFKTISIKWLEVIECEEA